MQPRTLFTVTDTFALRGRGTVLVGPQMSEVRGVVSVGDEVELKFPDGRTVRSRVTGVEPFMGPPTSDPGVGVGLADVIEVPQGTTVHPADDHSVPRVLEYAVRPAPWWLRHKRVLFLIALFLLLFALTAVLERLGLKPGDMLWDARNSP